MPEWVTTDNGTEFAGAFRHQLECFGIDQVQTSAYHPQSKSAVERLVRTMKDMLAAKIAAWCHPWLGCIATAATHGVRVTSTVDHGILTQ